MVELRETFRKGRSESRGRDFQAEETAGTKVLRQEHVWLERESVKVTQLCPTLCNLMDCSPLSMEFSRQK